VRGASEVIAEGSGSSLAPRFEEVERGPGSSLNDYIRREKELLAQLENSAKYSYFQAGRVDR